LLSISKRSSSQYRVNAGHSVSAQRIAAVVPDLRESFVSETSNQLSTTRAMVELGFGEPVVVDPVAVPEPQLRWHAKRRSVPKLLGPEAKPGIVPGPRTCAARAPHLNHKIPEKANEKPTLCDIATHQPFSPIFPAICF
jgi:hypothetical protein